MKSPVPQARVSADQPVCTSCQKQPARIDPVYGALRCLGCHEQHTSHPPVGRWPGFDASRREESRKHAKDILQPYRSDSRGRMTVNDDFVREYPDKVHLHYKPDQLRRSGRKSLAQHVEKLEKRDMALKQRDRDQIDSSSPAA